MAEKIKIDVQIEIAAAKKNISVLRQEIEKIKTKYKELQGSTKKAFDPDPIAAQHSLIYKLENRIDKLRESKRKAWNTDDITKYNKQLESAEKKLAEYNKLGVKASKEVSKEVTATTKAFNYLKGAIIATFAIGTIKAFIGKIYEVTMANERLVASLKQQMGSDTIAEITMVQLESLAKKVPFVTDDLINAFINFRRKGIEVTVGEMEKLSDVATAQRLTFDQLSEVISNATLGSFKGLRQMSVQVVQKGDELELTYHNVTTTIKNTDEALTKYLISLADHVSMSGAAAKANETLYGANIQLKNSLESLYKTLGEGEGQSSFIKSMSSLASWISTPFKTFFTEAKEEVANFIDELGGLSDVEVISKLQTKIMQLSKEFKSLYDSGKGITRLPVIKEEVKILQKLIDEYKEIVRKKNEGSIATGDEINKYDELKKSIELLNIQLEKEVANNDDNRVSTARLLSEKTSLLKKYDDEIAKLKEVKKALEDIEINKYDELKKSIETLNIQLEKEVANNDDNRVSTARLLSEKTSLLKKYDDEIVKLKEVKKALEDIEIVSIPSRKISQKTLDKITISVYDELKKNIELLNIQLEKEVANNDDNKVSTARLLREKTSLLKKYDDEIAKLKEVKKATDSAGGTWLNKIFGDKDQQKELVKQVEDTTEQILDIITTMHEQRLEQLDFELEQTNNKVSESLQLMEMEQKRQEEGLANNYSAEKLNYEKLTKLREQQIKEREKEAQKIRRIEAVAQAAGLLTATVNIIKNMTKITPIGAIILSGIQIAAMWGAFAAAQSKAKSLTKLAKGGTIVGDSHDNGGVWIPGTNIEVEGGEEVINKKTSSKFRPLIQALNKEDFVTVNKMLVKEIKERELQSQGGTMNHMVRLDDSKSLGETNKLMREFLRTGQYYDKNGNLILRKGIVTRKIIMN